MRGQITALDALVAILLFASVYSILNSMYAGVETERDDFDFLALKAKLVSSHLLTSSGEPFNWNALTASQLGLVVRRGVIEQEKLGNFLNLSASNINTTRNLLGISGLNFYFNVSYLNGTMVLVNTANFNGTATAGTDFSTSPVVYSRSLAVYNGNRVFVNIKLGT